MLSLLLEALKKFGLNQKEAAVYLALIELGRAKVQDIAKKTKLPRSTIYSVLEALSERGFIFPFEEGKIKLFAPQDPRKLLQDTAERAAAMKDIFPELRRVYQEAKSLPQIRYYEGQEALHDAYRSILKMKGLKSYDIVAAEGEWSHLGPHFIEEFKKRRAAAGIKTRLILDYSEAALARKRESEKTLSEVKIIPPGFGWKFTAGCYIFDDRVIFVAYKKESVAAEIISKEIAGLLKMMFSFMWQFLAP